MKNKSSNKIIVVKNKDNSVQAYIIIRDEKVVLLDKNGILLKNKLEKVLKEDVFIKKELFNFGDGFKFSLFRKKIEKSDEKYAKALNEKILNMGLSANLLEGKTAELFLLIEQSIISEEVKNKLVNNLHKFSEQNIDDLIKIFKESSASYNNLLSETLKELKR